MIMDEKKLNKKKQEIEEAQKIRERQKVRYDASVIILNGQRETVNRLEEESRKCLEDFIKADNDVKTKINELNELTNITVQEDAAN